MTEVWCAIHTYSAKNFTIDLLELCKVLAKQSVLHCQQMVMDTLYSRLNITAKGKQLFEYQSLA